MGKFELMALPYALDALEPVISKQMSEGRFPDMKISGMKCPPKVRQKLSGFISF